jgi:CRP-like cAMP-binding protein
LCRLFFSHLREKPMSTPNPPVPFNKLLHGLPVSEQRILVADTQSLHLEFAQILHEPAQRIRYVYFPLDSFISMVAAFDVDARVEVGIVGNEGMLGIDLVHDVQDAGLQAVVQGSGQALRMPAGVFEKHLARSPVLRRRMLRYAAVLMEQAARIAVCNGFHVTEQRLARWLLMSVDRSGNNSIRLTQRFLAYMLGVRRVSISTAAGTLQKKKVIEYKRGMITVLDRPALEGRACSCYGADLLSYSRLLG